MPETVLKAAHISKTFKKDGAKIEAVKNVSFELKAGEILGIAGESGSGKSTLSRLCMNLIRPDSGEIFICGERLDTKSVKKLRTKIQMVFQNPADTFNPAYSVGAGLIGAGRDLGLKKDEAAARIGELLELTGLPNSVLRRRPKELSGGQLQRLATVRALLCSPRVLIADEAVSSLDVSVSANMINLFSDLREQLGVSILFISHDLAVIGHISDRIGVMLNGELVEMGETEKVLLNPEHEYTKRLLDARL